MAKHRIAVIPGDGVGPEVIRGGIKVLTTVQGRMSGLSFEFGYFPWGVRLLSKEREADA